MFSSMNEQEKNELMELFENIHSKKKSRMIRKIVALIMKHEMIICRNDHVLSVVSPSIQHLIDQSFFDEKSRSNIVRCLMDEWVSKQKNKNDKESKVKEFKITTTVIDDSSSLKDVLDLLPGSPAKLRYGDVDEVKELGKIAKKHNVVIITAVQS